MSDLAHEHNHPMSHGNITHNRLKKALAFDPESGVWIWLFSWKRARAGVEAGWVNPSDGYRYIGIYGKVYGAHRLAWFYMTGAWPRNQIDHVDLNKTNNCWTNLRESTDSQNKLNRSTRRDSQSGMKCIEFNHSKWAVRTTVDGIRHSIGRYASKEAAVKARDDALRILHGEFARLQ